MNLFESELSLGKKKIVNGVLLLILACFLWRCSKKDSTNFNNQIPDAYIKVDSTYVGIRTVASDLNEPWEIAWGPNNSIWMTEHGGTVVKIDPQTGKKKVMLKVPDVYEGTTPGMLGMAIYPNQEKFPYLFVLYTLKKSEEDIVLNLVQYKINQDTLSDAKKLLEIPSAKHHAGSRIKISPDGKLFIVDGDAEKDAQNVHSMVGKVLRLNIDGSVPKDNPFPGSPVWAWGFRNPQGLAFGNNNILYNSMHGPASDDEVNIIRKKGNYGWPEVNGFCDKPDEMKFCADSTIQEPIKAWTPTIAPAGLDYYGSSKIPEWQNSLILTTLKDASVHVLSLNQQGTAIDTEHVFLKKKYGRLRDVCISPQGDIYVSTSNRDWNPDPGEGFPAPTDDRIIRLYKINDISSLKDVPRIDTKVDSAQAKKLSTGATIYESFCASCHKADGKGVEGSIPPLAKSRLVTGNKDELISLVLQGTSKPMEINGVKYQGEMPSFEFLNDEKVSKVLTYIRSKFNNNASKVSEKEVKNVRSNKDESSN